MSYLMAGTGRSDITPAPGTPQGGWGAQTHQRGLGADFPFYATALVLSEGDVSVAIIDVDSIGFDREFATKIVQGVADLTGIPSDHIRLSSSHTHSGANTFRLANISEGLEMVVRYLDSLPSRIAGAAWQARQNLKRVRCATGAGTCEIGVNRRFRAPDGRFVVGRNWSGPVDPAVRVLRFDDLDENPVATIVHYACHPTTMAWQCQHFTPDYPGVMRHVVEQQVGGTCLFLQGAAGNIHTRRGHGGDLRIYRRWGKLLGLEASKVAIALETLPRVERFEGVLQSGAAIASYRDEPFEPEDPCLGMISCDLKLPLREYPDPSKLEADVEKLREDLNHMRKEGTEEELRAATARVTQAGMQAEYARLYHGKIHVDWPLQAIRIGSAALLSIPGEPFIEISQQIVERSPFRYTLFSGYSNGGFGYLPVRRAFEEGGYELQICPFSPDAADIVVSECAAVLKKLHSRTN